MIEIVKKYLEEPKEIKLAEEIIDSFEKEKKKSKTPKIELEKVSINNFGNLKNFEMEFDKAVTFFQGPRNSGKSFAMESVLYLLTGGSRDIKGVIGEFDDKISGELEFNNLVSKWSRSDTSGKFSLKNKKDDIPISTKINDVKSLVEEYTGINADLLTSTIYYSPRLSFQFSRMMPFQVEELIIKLARLDIWLELESFTKGIKKDELAKINEINGAIGYISEINMTKDEIEKIIDKNEKEIKDLDKQIEKIAIPDITTMNKEYNKIRDQVQKRKDIEQKIISLSKLMEDLESKKKLFEEVGREIEKLKDFPEALNKKNGKIFELSDKLNTIKNNGIHIKGKIEEKEKMTKVSSCPVLNIDCNSLKENNQKILEQISELNSEREKLLKDYESTQKELNEFKKELEDLSRKQKLYNELCYANSLREKDIKSLEASLGKIDDEKKLNVELEKYPKSLETEMEDLNKKMQNINKEIKEKDREKDEVNNTKLDLLSDVKNYKQKIADLEKMDKFIKEKKKLENRQGLFDKLITAFGKKEIPKKEARKTLKKINDHLNIVLDKLSGKTIQAELNESFEMSIQIANHKKSLSAKVLSEGEEFVVNLSFVLACNLSMFNGEAPYFFADDVLAFQSDVTAEEIIRGLIKLQKEKYIGKLYLCSNRLKDLKLKDCADIIYEFDNGNYKVK